MSDIDPGELRDIGTSLHQLANDLRKPGSLRRLSVNQVAMILDRIDVELQDHAKRLEETPAMRAMRETHEVAVKAASGQRRPKDRIHRVTGEVLAGAWEMGKHS